MNYPTEKPHLIFLIAIPIILLIGLLSGAATLDINIQDTYYVIEYNHLTMLISILFGMIGIGYWIMKKANKKLSKWLNLTHIGLTFGGILIVIILSQFYRTESKEFEFNYNLTLIITLVILITVIAQIVFPINLIHGFFEKKNKTSG